MKKTLLSTVCLLGAGVVFGQTNTFPATGNAGIGTLSPTVKLEEVNSRTGAPANIKYVRFNDVAEAWDTDGYVRQVWDINVLTHYFDQAFDAPGLDFRVGYVLNPSSNNPALPSTSSSVLKLSMDGLVGVGVPSPLEKLHVGGNVRIDGLAGSNTRMVTVNNVGVLSTQAIPLQTLSISGNSLSISGGNTVTLPATAAQNLSFSGTTLTISGGNSVSLSTLKDNLGNHTATSTLNMAFNPITSVSNISFTGGGSIFGSTITSPTTLSTLSNFGIAGSGSTAYELDVKGGNGYIRCYDVYEVSDRRFKSNILEIENPLETIQRLQGVGYDFTKNEGETKHDYGFIAQDLQKVLPELVREDENGYLAINYTGVVPFLVQGIKDQQSIIDQQNLRIEKLEKAVEELLAASPVRPSAPENGPILFQNTPNPFNGLTQIKCVLPQGVSDAQIVLYNISGVQIRAIAVNGSGEQTITLDSKDLSANIYVYSLLVDGKLVDSKRMIVTQY